MIWRHLKGTNGSWCQSRSRIGMRHHCQRPLQFNKTIRGQYVCVGYDLLFELSSAALSNARCPLFSALVSRAARFSTLLYLRF